MAFLLNNSISSHFRSRPLQSGDGLISARRRYHIEPGAREKALLAEDPAINRFKSYKKGVQNVKRVGDVLTIIVVAGCCYEIYIRAIMREEARKNAGKVAQD